MSSFPNSPRVQKGAVVAMDPFNPLASVVVFQYNPAELTRSLSPKAPGKDDGPVDTLRLAGPPTETISLTVTIDAADQLETGGKLATTMGIYPQLASLEMMLYPKSALVIANTVLAALGTLEIEPPQAPLTLFIWGAKRVVPVKLESIQITEQYHDPSLNPITAQATLSMRVLTYDDFTSTQAGYYLYLAYQVVKEAMATAGSINNLAGMAGGS